MNPLRLLVLAALCALFFGCASSTFNQGRRALDSGNAEEAIRLLEAARADHPDDPRIQRELGIAYYKNKQLDLALTYLSGARQALPRDGRTAFYLGATLEGLERYDEAIEAYRHYTSVEGGTERREMEARVRILKRKQLLADAKRALAQEQALAGKPTVAPRGTVAVPPFDAASLGTRASLGRGVAVLVATDLSMVKQLRVLERQRINVLMDELAMAETGDKEAPVPPRPDADWSPTAMVRGIKERLAFVLRADGEPYYTGAINDDDDESYKSAVQLFQTDNGLKADGRAGPKTLEILEAAVARRMRETPVPTSPRAPDMDRATAPAVGRILRAGTVVSGSITSVGGETVRLDVITSTPGPNEMESGNVEAGGQLNALFDLEKAIVFGLLDTMRVTPTPEERQAILNYRPTKSMEAFLAYCEGLEQEARRNYSQAEEAFQRAVSIDPGFSEASDAAEENGDLAIAAGAGFNLEPPEMAFLPPPSIDPLDDRLETSLGQAGQSLGSSDPQTTEPRFGGIGNPPPRPGP